MTTRRFVLHLIVGLLTFLIGVTVAIALGGFDPLARFTRSNSRHQFAIPQQTLSTPDGTTERYRGCRMRSRTRTAELRYYELDSSPVPPAPAVPEVPFNEDDAPPPPHAPRARR